MGLNMMNIMHFATERTVSCHPYGVSIVVCRQEFHCIPQPAYRPASLQDFAAQIKKDENEYVIKTMDIIR